jgi:hypothetical protein
VTCELPPFGQSCQENNPAASHNSKNGRAWDAHNYYRFSRLRHNCLQNCGFLLIKLGVRKDEKERKGNKQQETRFFMPRKANRVIRPFAGAVPRALTSATAYLLAILFFLFSGAQGVQAAGVPPVDALNVSPASVSLGPLQTHQFTVNISAALRQRKVILYAVIWSVSPPVGSITAAGLYTAPPSIAASQAVTVTATNLTNPSVSAKATVTLNPGESVTVSPASGSLTQSQTQSFFATVTGSSNIGVIWSLTPLVGSITADGLYTAPISITSPQAVTVKATSLADPSKSASAAVTLIPAVTISLTPSSVSLLPSQDQTFTATVSGTNNNGVTWSFTPALASVANGAGTTLYIAPSTAPINQRGTITATSVADPSKTATAVISLLQAVTVSLSPWSVSLTSAGTQQFTPTVIGTGNTAVTWSINPSAGAISSAGLYTAPSSISPLSQTVIVTAQSVADPTQSANATVILSPPTATFTYYVDSANGSDSNPGTQTEPWKTVTKVNSTTFSPGQSVGFARGEAWRETLAPGQSGTATSPITFGAYGTGARPVINGSDVVSSFVADTVAGVWAAKVPTQPHAVWLDQQSIGIPALSKAALSGQTRWFWDSGILYFYAPTNPEVGHVIEAASRVNSIFISEVNHITISDLEAKFANDRSVFLRNCTDAVLQSMTIHDSANQNVMIGIGGGGHRISNTEIYNSGLNSGFGAGSGLHIQNTTIPSAIDHSYIHDVDNRLGDHAAYDESGGNTYTYNHLQSYSMAVKLGASSTMLAYNLIENTAQGGIDIEALSNIKIYNNTIYEAGGISPYSAIWYNGDAAQTGIDVRNNLIYYSRGVYSVGLITESGAAGWKSDYNDIFVSYFGVWHGGTELNLTEWRSASGLDSHSINSDPLLTNPGAGDFTLKVGSPVIGAGVYIPGVSTSAQPNIGAF